MRRMIVAGLWAVLLGGFAAAAEPDTPIGSRWWPSHWGKDDQRGAANRLTPEKVLEAKELIREGKTYQLGRVYEHGMPVPGKRHYSLTIPGLPTGQPSAAKNHLVHNDELISGEIGQIGTQFDGLGHVGVRVNGEDVFYNGNKLSEFGDTYGLKKLGVENVGPIFTRGVLIDVATRHGRPLPIGHVITADDLKQCLSGAKLKLRPGDAVLIHTGHGQLWMKDNKQFAEGEPGIGMEAARWLSDQQVSLVGSDNWAIEAVPPEDPERPFDCHLHLLVRHGIYLLENLDLQPLVDDKAYEFAFVFSPLRLKGATGSPGNPIAIK